MKIIGICGSPRKGNTEWMLGKLLEAVAKAGAETELILLRELNMAGCDGCLACEAGGRQRKGVCRIKDDMRHVYPKLLGADGLVLGSPVYFEMISGQLKTFMDRTCPIWPRLEGKSMAGVVVAEEGIGKAVQNLRTYARVCGLHWAGCATALARSPGQVSGNRRLEKRLELVARNLTSAIARGDIEA
jgi:multimeric flavodoxin WrbA